MLFYKVICIFVLAKGDIWGMFDKIFFFFFFKLLFQKKFCLDPRMELLALILRKKVKN